jgi:hypothetical protein
VSQQAKLLVNMMGARFSPLGALLEEHLRDNKGEVLPHVFFGDATRYILSLVGSSKKAGLSPRRELRDILAYLEEPYSGGDSEVQELISASFLENLPRIDEAVSQIRQMLGPNLRRKLAGMNFPRR